VRRGLFSAVLGSQTPFPLSLTFERQYWLGIQPGGDPELLPRIALSAVGYSLNALRADTARVALNAGIFADSARIAGTVPDNSITASKIAAGQVVKSINNIRDAVTLSAQGGATITSSGDTITINAGSGGGGTGVQGLQNTNNTLDIINPSGPTVTANLKVPLAMSAASNYGNGPVLRVRNTQANGDNAIEGITQGYIGVYGESRGTYGVYGLSKNVAGVGVYGGTYGIDNTQSAGVYGGGGYHGVVGYSNSSASGASGVWGNAENSIGVLGSSNNGTGVFGQGGSHGGSFFGRNFGVYGNGATGVYGQGGTHGGSFVGSDFGVYARANNPNGVAGFFDGKVSVAVAEIRGGGDLAEPFAMEKDSPLEPGTVMVIDTDHPGKLAVSRTAYDRKVAGIISGAGGIKTGMLMSQSGSIADGRYPVALTGRVYCWADASNGPIEPGDLLTTSDTPGHAMKVTNHKKAQGAIIGKAMTGLERGKGLVLVLVTLQ
jgi:hypothetical protein